MAMVRSRLLVMLVPALLRNRLAAVRVAPKEQAPPYLVPAAEGKPHSDFGSNNLRFDIRRSTFFLLPSET